MVVAAAASGALGIIILATHFARKNPVYIRGAVVATDSDPAKELPVADVEVAVINDSSVGVVRTDASGFFSIPMPLRQRIRFGFPVGLNFRHPDYHPFELPDVTGDKLYIARLIPLAGVAPARLHGPEVKVGNIVAKYSITTTTVVNVGSAVRTFQVVNVGNVPCKGHSPCSPDGKWKAATGGVTLDAGRGNEFHNARASCVAGPCPFTRIESDKFLQASRTLQVSALNWSDTTTFLLEAEVYKSVVSEFCESPIL